MFEDLSEKLFTHYVGGAWRAPLTTRARPVRLADGSEPGQIILAGPADIARAHASAVAASALIDNNAESTAQRAAALAASLHRAAPNLAAALALERGLPRAAAEAQIAAFLAALPCNIVRAKLPLVLLTAARTSPVQLARPLCAALVAGRPVIWKPAPGGAVFATFLIDALHRAGLAPGALALLHGDGQDTGAALAALPGVEARILHDD